MKIFADRNVKKFRFSSVSFICKHPEQVGGGSPLPGKG